MAIVNKTTSAKFNLLVQNAEELIKKLPWSEHFEKPVFSKPDFTDLEVSHEPIPNDVFLLLQIVAFGCSGTPIGINIPNYDDIR